MGDWGNIPTEIATIIAEYLLFVEDFEAFGFVCSSWRIGAKQAKFRAKLSSSSSIKSSPWLMLPELDTAASNQRRFYSLYNRKVRTTNLPIPPSYHYNIKLLSSNGWLLSVTNEGSNLCLVNPLSGATISLPKVRFWNHLHRCFSYYDDYCDVRYFGKFFLSGNPSSSTDFSIALVLSEPFKNQCDRFETISFWKKGNDEWQPISRVDNGFVIYYNDMIFYEGNFYSVDNYGTIRCYEFDHLGCPHEQVVARLKNDDLLYQCHEEMTSKVLAQYYYLIESENQLLVVCRVREKAKVDESLYEIKTVSFMVFELSVVNEVIGVPDLGDVAIFVGLSSSFSTKANSNNGIKGNSIYFTDDYREQHYWTFGLSCKRKGVEMGIFNLADENIYQLDCVDEAVVEPYLWLENPSF